MNSAQVRAKARMAMKRREEELEAEEMEGGELNLVPYLDIITNVVLFLLASVTTGLVIGNINAALPESQQNAAQNPNPQADQSIQLVVAVTKKEIRLFSVSGKEGTIAQPKLTIPATVPAKQYDIEKLRTEAYEVVKRNFCAGAQPCTKVKPVQVQSRTTLEPVCVVEGREVGLENCRDGKATEVFLMVDGEIPYDVVIQAMDALRKAPDGTDLFPGVIFSAGLQQQ
jgi:biopolymer transport protein ExbD